VSGSPLPAVEWTKDGAQLGDGQFDGKSVRFRVESAEMKNSGLYQCKLTNESGTAMSEAPVTIRKVFTKPEFKVKDAFVDTQQTPRRDVKFEAKVSGNPFPSISWAKDDFPIKPSPKYDIQRIGDNISYALCKFREKKCGMTN